MKRLLLLALLAGCGGDAAIPEAALYFDGDTLYCPAADEVVLHEDDWPVAAHCYWRCAVLPDDRDPKPTVIIRFMDGAPDGIHRGEGC